MRKVFNFNTKWAFSKEATEAPIVMPEKWYWVSLPHTWNDIDGQDGGNDLYRGTSFYAKELEKISNNIYELCLEDTHINMAITKIGGMLRTNKIKRIIFASVDKSPHCIQLHYIQDELQKMMNLSNIEIGDYVVHNIHGIGIYNGLKSLTQNGLMKDYLETKIVNLTIE